ncbi:MAG: 4Fe-4S ferredoxin [Candidatus Omnitrophica bacterium CG11_big_fil_rev_8_21_14_0_20_43_6]|nr:MAG: 4Fe-4S ferredoxin [Candidatus Omnitrophica bacterium CG11_big_fil_rev_8_21_14_0_20_43_6]
MAKRKIITIDEQKCNGCALCIPNCPEGAIQIIDQKARLISDLFCDGLGACIGHCPQGAITIEEREAQSYDEKRVMANIVRQGPNVIKAHLKHLQEHQELVYLKQAMDFLKKKNINITLDAACHYVSGGSGCPGSKMMDFRKKVPPTATGKVNVDSALAQWPVQLHLVPAHAPYFEDADLLIAADCVPFAYANFHQDLLAGKILLVGCPKLDDVSLYADKLKQIFADNNIKSITYAHMEVPCCFGLLAVIKEAISNSGKKIPFEDITITIKGEKV